MSDILAKAAVTVVLLLIIGFWTDRLIKKYQSLPNEFITDTNGCQYFKKSERPRMNPNGTQICKAL